MNNNLFFNPYIKPVKSTRTGAIFNVHPYPTKINYKGIVPFILAHTKPDDVVYDSFAGTCSTGFAAASCSERNDSILDIFGDDAKSNVVWGPRKAVCVDLGVLPTYIGRTLATPIDCVELDTIFTNWMEAIEKKWGWLYNTKNPDNEPAKIKYTYYTDLFFCHKCGAELKYSDIFVDFDEGNFLSKSKCSQCSVELNSDDLVPVEETIYDRVLNKNIKRVKRKPFRVYGVSEKKRWNRISNSHDENDIEIIRSTPLPDILKPILMMNESKERWGEMYRAGYHKYIKYVHQFYSDRNLTSISILYDEASKLPSPYKEAIILIISSYNVAHSTIMTRFVFKSGSNKPVNTSAQPGVLYVPRCNVEKNVFDGVKAKYKQLKKALQELAAWNSDIDVKTVPAQQTGLDPESIDYIFTDPPFGQNIQYSEVNFISESWLGLYTKNEYETIISRHQKKTVLSYENLLTGAFSENYRLLKPGGYMTVVFHSTKAKVWNALIDSIRNSGFLIVDTSILSKTQSSFKQTTTKGAVGQDPIILAKKPTRSAVKYTSGHMNPEQFIFTHLKDLPETSQERLFDFIFSRYVGHIISSGDNIELNSVSFKSILSNLAKETKGFWFLKGIMENET